MTHTPAPWKAKNDLIIRENGEASNFYTISGPDHSHVCFVTEVPTRTGGIGSDACLIAAAPDLLEALETTHRVLLWAERRMASPDYADVIANDARNLHKVIAKAKSEA